MAQGKGERILTEAGDTVAWRRTLGGTHKAAMMGIPASGQKVEWSNMLVTCFEGSKTVEEWAVSDLAGQLFSRPVHA